MVENLLLKRFKRFSIDIVKLSKSTSKDLENRIILNQLVRASLSIGANYSEAQNAYSRKDFFNKVGISRKEAKEVLYWLEIYEETISTIKVKALLAEAKEINLILSAILKKKLQN